MQGTGFVLKEDSTLALLVTFQPPNMCRDTNIQELITIMFNTFWLSVSGLINHTGIYTKLMYFLTAIKYETTLELLQYFTEMKLIPGCGLYSDVVTEMRYELYQLIVNIKAKPYIP